MIVATKRYLEIVPELTLESKISESEKIEWEGYVYYRVRDNLKVGIWSVDWTPKEKELAKLGLTRADYRSLENLVMEMNMKEEHFFASSKENLIDDVQLHLTEMAQVLEMTSNEETIKFDAVARVEQP